jgi:hypothetical protein
MLVRVLRRVLRPGPRLGLFRSGETQSPVFNWILDPSYWGEFAEVVEGLARTAHEENHQYLDSQYPHDATVVVEYRRRLDVPTEQAQAERAEPTSPTG